MIYLDCTEERKRRKKEKKERKRNLRQKTDDGDSGDDRVDWSSLVCIYICGGLFVL